MSNNGEPMRRFMQTFVLAPQTPKKFYVHNDIFRYQDEVYQDNSDTESEDPQQTDVTSLSNNNKNVSSVNYYQASSVVDQQLETNEVNVVINPALNVAAVNNNSNTLTSSLSTSVTSSSSSSSSAATVSTSPSSQVVLQQQQEHVVSQTTELVVEQQQTVTVAETVAAPIVNGHGSDSVGHHLEETPVEASESVKEKSAETKSTTSSTLSGKEELKQEIVQNAGNFCFFFSQLLKNKSN